MIVRERSEGFVLIPQHDHALASGEFARRVRTPEGSPSGETFFAISNHDLGWKRLDRKVLWNERTGKPYSFTDYPPKLKMEAYTEGIEKVQAESPYAALLCSAHYGTFVERSEEPHEARFREQEKRRREDLRENLRTDLGESSLRFFERDLRLLKLSDDLSLSVCLNEPGTNEHPFYRGGISYSGRTFRPVWEDERNLRFEPDLFRETFDVTLPYALVDRAGETLREGCLTFRIAGG